MRMDATPFGPQRTTKGVRMDATPFGYIIGYGRSSPLPKRDGEAMVSHTSLIKDASKIKSIPFPDHQVVVVDPLSDTATPVN